MLRLLHSADLHVGDSRHILPEKYLDRQYRMLYEIKRIALKFKCDVVTIAGDVFDKKEPKQEEKDLVLSWLLGMDSSGISTIIIPGNHDTISPGYTTIHYLKILYDNDRFENIHIVEGVPRLFIIKKHAFACIPCRHDINSNVDRLYKKLDEKPDAYFVVAHGYVHGLVTDSNYKVTKDTIKVQDKDFVTAFLFGDVHKRQEFARGKGLMCGAPIQHKWGDKLPKTVSLIDVNGGKIVKKKYIKLKGIEPLVVVDDVDDVPENAIVKLMSMKGVAHSDLPANVVEVTDYVNEEDIYETNSGFKVVDGLAEYLAEKGFDKKEQKLAVNFVEGIKL